MRDYQDYMDMMRGSTVPMILPDAKKLHPEPKPEGPEIDPSSAKMQVSPPHHSGGFILNIS